MEEKPLFKHQCAVNLCVFLGTFQGKDLYFHNEKEHHVIFVRFGNNLGDYEKGTIENNPAYVEAAQRAIDRGLLDPEETIGSGTKKYKDFVKISSTDTRAKYFDKNKNINFMVPPIIDAMRKIDKIAEDLMGQMKKDGLTTPETDVVLYYLAKTIFFPIVTEMKSSKI